jgi:nucleoside 2-deoxyribosyltransferase
MIYLASPYSDPDVTVREQRFREACRATAWLVQAGHAVFSPVVQGHPLADLGLPTDWCFWESRDRDHLARCDEMAVLMIEGWFRSTGVAAEIQIAGELGKPVWYLPPKRLAVRPSWAPTLAQVAKMARI